MYITFPDELFTNEHNTENEWMKNEQMK